MKAIADGIRIQYNENQKPELVLSICSGRYELLQGITELKEVAKEKKLAVEVKRHREKRSLDANAYLWKLLSEIAEVLHASKDEIYLQMLERYGKRFTHIIVKPEAVEAFKKEWRAVRDLGEVTVNGKTGIQLQCYYGSSTYDSKDFSVLLDGVISEAKELGIETLPPHERDEMIKEWNQK
jgi:hypothetical protein